jgi:hypothetical protein
MRRIDSSVSAPESSTPSPISPASLSTSARLSTLPTDTASAVRGPAYSLSVDIDIATGSGGHR